MNIERLRHGHDHAGGPAARRSSRDPRGGLHAGDAVGARHRRPSRTAKRRQSTRCAKRPARHRIPGAARLRGTVRATCTSTRSTSPSRCCRCAMRSARDVLLVLLDDVGACHRRPRSHSSRDLRKLAMLAVPLGIASRTRRCRGAGIVNELPRRGTWSSAPTAQPRARAWIRITCSRPETPARRAGVTSIPRASSSCSSPTSCGQRRPTAGRAA